jgi:hypothetical protein
MQPVLGAPYDPDVVTAPFVFSDSKGTSFDPTWASQWTLPATRHVYEMIAFSAMAHLEPPERVLIAARWGSKATGDCVGDVPDLCRGMRGSAHTEEELVEIFACRRPELGALLERGQRMYPGKRGTWRSP